MRIFQSSASRPKCIKKRRCASVEPQKLLKLLREIQAIIRESKLRTPNEENKPDWIIGYAFAMASFDLDLLIATTRLRNRVKRLLDKLGWKHPLSLKTFSLLQILEEAVTRRGKTIAEDRIREFIVQLLELDLA
jgi:hypothetical protein